MANMGLNVARDSSSNLNAVVSLNATWIRIVAMPDHDLTDYLRSARARNLKVLLVLARESFIEPGPRQDMYALYKQRYVDTGLVHAIQVGNEMDHASPSSWSMSQKEFESFGKSVRAAFPTTTIVTGGLVSGQPSWLAGVDLSWAQAISLHPYGKSPSETWPHPGWGTGYIGDFLDSYAVYGKPLLITEVGLSTDEVTEEFQAAYCQRMVDYFARRTDILGVMWFCISDQMT